MNIKVGQVYRCVSPRDFPDFIITEVEPIIKAKYTEDSIDVEPWELNVEVISNKHFILVTKLEKAMR